MQLEAYSELFGLPIAAYSLETSLPTYFRAVSRLAVSAGAVSVTGLLSTGSVFSSLEEAAVSCFAGLDFAAVSALDSALDSAFDSALDSAGFSDAPRLPQKKLQKLPPRQPRFPHSLRRSSLQCHNGNRFGFHSRGSRSFLLLPRIPMPEASHRRALHPSSYSLHSFCLFLLSILSVSRPGQQKTHSPSDRNAAFSCCSRTFCGRYAVNGCIPSLQGEAS